jgi:hypothetical protein
MSTVVPWDVPIRAEWYRSTDLAHLQFSGQGLVLELIEEETEHRWRLTFEAVQAVKVTTEECAVGILERLPQQGGFFEVRGSVWLSELGLGRISFLQEAQHLIICCYDEIVEVIGSKPSFERLSNPPAEPDSPLEGKQR